MSETAGEVLSRTILKMGGKKSLGHKWQWRKVVILIEAKLRYWDAKTDTYRGEINLEGSETVMITEKDELYSKLIKLKKPKAPEGVVDIASPAFFSIKPRDGVKTYYFGVPANERSLWIGYINDAHDGMKGFREALRLKRGATASPSPSVSSSTLLGNLQPIGGGSFTPNSVVQYNSSVSSTGSGGSSSISSMSGGSFGPASGRSWASNASINSSTSHGSTPRSDHDPRVTTIEGGMMPGGLSQHSASAPPARQIISITSTNPLTPRTEPIDDDPFGLMAVHNEVSPSSAVLPTTDKQESLPPTSSVESLSLSNPSIQNSQTSGSVPSSPSPFTLSPRNSPAPHQVGTTVVGEMPQPILPQISSVRDSFVFDSVL